MRSDGYLIAGLLAACCGLSGCSDGSDQAPVTPVTECGVEISEPGNYRVTGGLLACPGVAIVISESDVSLSLGENEIRCERVDGRGDYGILALAVVNISIEGGRISNCDRGIVFLGTSDSKITGVELSQNLFYPTEGDGTGILLIDASNNEVVGNRASENRTGIQLINSNGNRIIQNVTNDNITPTDSPIPLFGIGIALALSNDNEIAGNEANRNNLTGIALGANSSRNKVHDNSANENGSNGVGVFGRVDFPPPDGDIGIENVLERNSAQGNGNADMLEVDWDPFADPPETVVEPCRNTWRENTFVSYLGPEMCIE